MNAHQVNIRKGTSKDVPFLRQMLFEAAYWRPDRPRPPVDEALKDPHVSLYIVRWGRPGDAAVVALNEDGMLIGAAWYRLFVSEEHGYGFIDSSTPEISIAAVPEHRGCGIGRALLNALIDIAASGGFVALSLSVEKDNPASGVSTLLLHHKMWGQRLRAMTS